MADENLIGLGTCPVCRQPEARFTLSKSNLVVCRCRQRGCDIQLFSRNGDADEKLRAFMTDAPPEPAMPPAPAPTPAPSPTAAPVDAAPKPETKKPGWGFMGAING